MNFYYKLKMSKVKDMLEGEARDDTIVETLDTDYENIQFFNYLNHWFPKWSRWTSRGLR